MILNEPPRTQYDLNFRLLGIPVRVHPLFWLVAVLLGMSGSQEALPLVLWIATVFVSILVHEMGHALTARAFGWQPWITLHGFGGLASYRPTRRDPASQILITLAGPAAGFAFAALVVGAIVASGHRIQFAWPETILPIRFEFYEKQSLNWLIIDLLYVNIFWGLMNLLPINPLDGGQIAMEVFQAVNPRDGVRQALWLSVIVAAVAGVLAYLRLQELFLAVFFGYMAYTNYMMLSANFGSGGGLGGWR